MVNCQQNTSAVKCLKEKHGERNQVTFSNFKIYIILVDFSQTLWFSVLYDSFCCVVILATCFKPSVSYDDQNLKVHLWESMFRFKIHLNWRKSHNLSCKFILQSLWNVCTNMECYDWFDWPWPLSYSPVYLSVGGDCLSCGEWTSKPDIIPSVLSFPWFILTVH